MGIYSRKISPIKKSIKYYPNSKGGWTQDGRKVKGTIHWVSSNHAIDAQIHLYNRLFKIENPNKIIFRLVKKVLERGTIWGN